MPTNVLDPPFFGDPNDNHSLNWRWDVARLPESTNNRIHATGLTTQLLDNSCTGRALKVAIDTFCNARGLQFDSSWQDLWEGGQTLQYGAPNPTAGAWNRYVLQHANTSGIANSGSSDRPTLDYRRILTGFGIDGIRAACSLGLPILCGINISYAFSALNGPLESQPATYPYTEHLSEGHPDFAGRHSVCILDITPTSVIGANSYGPSFGSEGLFAISHEALLANATDVYVLTRVGDLLAPNIPPRLIAQACPGREALGPQFVLNIRRAFEAMYANPSLTTQQARAASLLAGMTLYGVTRDEVAFSIPVERSVLDAFLSLA